MVMMKTLPNEEAGSPSRCALFGSISEEFDKVWNPEHQDVLAQGRLVACVLRMKLGPASQAGWLGSSL
jgi:hypothetical protein